MPLSNKARYSIRRSPRSAHRVKARLHGFSLVEVAIALVIFALLVGGLLVPLSAQVEQRRILTTQQQLEEIKAALMGYAAANGRLPCPSSGLNNGLESFAGGGNATNGNCSNFFNGFLPAVTLGLTPINGQGYALDAWALPQSRIRYAVSSRPLPLAANPVVSTDCAVTPALCQSNPFTAASGMKNVGIGNVASNEPNASLILVCSSSAGIGANCGIAAGPPPTLTLNSKAVFVVFSEAGNPGLGGAGADEQANLDNDPIFVSHPRTATAGNPFDDLVTWIGPSLLLNRMIEAGQLP